MDEKLSVIVPAYNAEQTIKKCLMSITNQTYKNLEIIVVDDGSVDNTNTIVSEILRDDSRVKYYYQENAGLSSARNRGIDVSTGDYIAFVDSDDYIEPKMFQLMMKHLISSNCGMSICGFVIEELNNPVILGNLEESKIEVLPAKEALHRINMRQNALNLNGVEAWNKVYKKSLFKEVRFPLNMLYEDNFIMHLLIDNANNIVYIHAPLYHYVQKPGSITNSRYSNRKLEGLKGYELRIEYFSIHYPEFVNEARVFFARTLIAHYKMAFYSDIENCKKLQQMYRDNFKKIKFNQISYKEQMLLQIFYISPSFTLKILKK